jgi:hypothetical protein
MEGEPGVLGWHGSQRALRSHWQFSAFQFSYLFDIAQPLHAVIRDAKYPVAFGQAATGSFQLTVRHETRSRDDLTDWGDLVMGCYGDVVRNMNG